jgi:ABC-type nitrate/sulfonate/bicarbonate transport system substrate-binding protein
MSSGVRFVGAALALGLLAGACGEDSSTDVVNRASGFPAQRCDANREAGQITFLTSFDYAAAASIIDVVAADAQGFFEAVCLDVKLQPGFSSDNVATVAAGRAQMTSLGSFSEVVVANTQGADLVAIGVEGHTSIEELLVEDEADITELSQLEGRKVGIKGAIPYSLRAMLAKAGVDESKLTQIEVDFNPVTLFETEIDALPAYKSNEPGQLDAAGYEGRYHAFDPRDDDVAASFAVFTTSSKFAKDHPTATADFLRAALKGYEWAAANPAAAVETTLQRSDPKLFFNPDGEKFRWDTERQLVADSTPSGRPVGWIDGAELAREVEALVSIGVVEAGEVDAAKSYDDRFIKEVTTGEQVAWFES